MMSQTVGTISESDQQNAISQKKHIFCARLRVNNGKISKNSKDSEKKQLLGNQIVFKRSGIL